MNLNAKVSKNLGDYTESSHLGIIKAIVRMGPHEPIIIIKKCQPMVFVARFFFKCPHWGRDLVNMIDLDHSGTISLKELQNGLMRLRGSQAHFWRKSTGKTPEVFSCSSPCLDWKEASDGNIYPDSLLENLMRKSPPFLVEKGNFKTYNVERFRNYIPKQFC